MTPEHAALAAKFTQNTVYLMGGSFLMGSLFTIFILVVLDMMRAMRERQAESAPEDNQEP